MLGWRWAIPVRHPPPPARADGVCSIGRTGHSCITVLEPSPDPLEPLGVLLPASHVEVGVLGDRLRGLLVERANRTGRRSQDQRIVRKCFALRNHGTSPDEAILSDPRAVEYDCTHTDQAVRRDDATVQDHVMADDAIVADLERETGVCV